jgi:hypothetical protein
MSMMPSTSFIGFALRFQIGFEMETMGGKAKENMKFVVFEGSFFYIHGY